MGLLKVSRCNIISDDTDNGILYLLIVRLECGKEVYKVGVTKRDKIEERVCEILASFWSAYRYFPYCYPKRFRTTDGVYKKEGAIHKLLKEKNYKFDKKFGGHTEFFHEITLEEIVKVYEDVVNETTESEL